LEDLQLLFKILDSNISKMITQLSFTSSRKGFSLVVYVYDFQWTMHKEL